MFLLLEKTVIPRLLFPGHCLDPTAVSDAKSPPASIYTPTGELCHNAAHFTMMSNYHMLNSEHSESIEIILECENISLGWPSKFIYNFQFLIS